MSTQPQGTRAGSGTGAPDSVDPKLPPAGTRPLYTSEDMALQAFKDATTKALDSADGACGTILTASFSIVTAYGAAVALVTPKGNPTPILLLAPFIAISLAAAAALVGKAAGVKLSGDWDDLDQDRSSIRKAVTLKRAASWTAVACLAIGMVVAGWVLLEHFGQPEEAAGDQVVGLTGPGKRLFEQACGVRAEELSGKVSVSGDFTTVTLAGPATCGGTSSVTLPSNAVAYLRAP